MVRLSCHVTPSGFCDLSNIFYNHYIPSGLLLHNRRSSWKEKSLSRATNILIVRSIKHRRGGMVIEKKDLRYATPKGWHDSY
jgi:hypothetical protein